MSPPPTALLTRALSRVSQLRSLLLLCIAGAALRAESYSWRNARIDGGGFVTGFVFHPTEPNLLYARTDVSGAFRWDQVTRQWIPLNTDVGGLNNEFMLLGVLSLAVDPSDPDKLYLACGQYNWDYSWNPSAIFRSSDRGTTWTKTDVTSLFKIGGNEDGRSCGERLAVDPHLGSTLYYGTNTAGLWRSTDSGVGWSRVTSFTATPTTTSCTFVVFDGRSGSAHAATQTIYVGVNSTVAANLWRSVDGGATWAAVPGQPIGAIPHHAALAADGTLYLAYSNTLGPGGASSGSVWKLNTTTGAWTSITPPTGQGGFAGISVSAQDPQRVVVSTLDRWWPRDVVYLSADGGGSWTDILTSRPFDSTLTPWSASASPHWIGSIAIDPFDAAHVLFGTGYGILASDNASVANTSWQFRSRGLEETAVLGLVSRTEGPMLVSAIGDYDGFAHDDLAVSPPTGRHSPNGGSNRSLDSAGNAPLLLVRSYDGGNRGGRSTDGGRTWTAFPTRPANAGAGSVAINADGTAIVWSMEKTGAQRSVDNGSTWTPCTGAPARSDATFAPCADRVTATRFYIYDHVAGKVYCSTDSGSTFTAAATVPTGGAPLVATPDNEGHLWLACGNSGLRRSTNAAQSFEVLPSVQEAYRIGLGKAAPGSTYPALYLWGKVDGIVGVFRSVDTGASWLRLNDNAHQFGYIGVIAGDARVFGRVFLGTGQGIICLEPAVPATPGSLPAGFATQDIGSTGPAGSAGGTLEAFVLRGSGTDIGGTSDGFRFAWRRTSGDCTVTARVDTLQATNLAAKAGVMLRDGTTASAPFAAAVQLPDNTVMLLWRAVAGGATTSYGPVATIDQPKYVRLIRSGDTFTAAYSTENLTWIQVGSPVTITMPAEVAAGVCLTSRNAETVAAAALSSISLQPEAVGITSPHTLPAGTLGEPYTLELAARGGFPGYTWSVAGGALPAGLTLSPDGTIAGILSAAGPSACTLSVTDQDGHSAQAQFALSVAGLAYPSWRTQNFTTAELADPAISGTTADPDNDGIPNLLEWAGGTAPKQRDTAPPTTFAVFVDTGTGAEYAELTFHWRIAAAGASYGVQSSTDLINWVDEQPTDAWQTTADSNGFTETVRARVPKTSPCRFLRLLVTAQN